jgi:thiaminase/transcriptional activator TenA
MHAAISAHLLPSLTAHPFNQQLSAGTLPKADFLRFVILDKWYLRGLCRALNNTAERLIEPAHQTLFINLATKIVRYECEMLNKYSPLTSQPHLFSQQCINKEAAERYVAHLLTCSRSDPALAVASVLPCFYVYRHLGRVMSQTPRPNNPYQLWIASYSSPSFLQYTAELMDVAEVLGRDTALHPQMMDAFVTSTQHELDFLNSVYPAHSLSNRCDNSSMITL